MVDTINELSGLSRKLNEKSDTLNATITKVEEKLNALNLGVEAWLDIALESGTPYYGEDDEAQRYPRKDVTVPGYAKISDEWCLAFREETWHQVEDNFGRTVWETQWAVDPRPLLSAPRNIRAKALSHVSDLLNVIKHNAEQLLKGIEAGEKAAEKL